MTWSISCPRCPDYLAQDVSEHVEELWASDERFKSTHTCNRCQTHFRYTPPTRSAPKEDACPQS
jgi:hypothetical protein